MGRISFTLGLALLAAIGYFTINCGRDAVEDLETFLKETDTLLEQYNPESLEKVVERAEKQLAAQRRAGDERGEALTAWQLGIAQNRMKDWDAAPQYLFLAYDYFQKTDEEASKALISWEIADVYKRLEDWDNTFVWAEQALSHAERSGDTLLQVRMKGYLANRHVKTSKSRLANEILAEAECEYLDWYQAQTQNEKPSGKHLDALFELGIGYYRLEIPNKALHYFDPILRSERSNQKGVTLNIVSLIHRSMGELVLAEATVRTAIESFPSIHSSAVGPCYLNLADYTFTLGDIAQAFQNFSMAEPYFMDPVTKKVISVNTLASIWLIKGSIHNKSGSPALAEPLLQKAADLFVQNKNGKAESETRIELGSCLDMLGQFDQAEEEFNKSLNLAEKLENQPLIIKAKMSLGSNSFLRGNYGQALSKYEECLQYESIHESRHWKAETLLGMARAALALGDIASATVNCKKALELFNDLNFPESAAFAQHLLARVEASKGNLFQAIELNQASSKQAESLLATIIGQQTRTTYMSRVRSIYLFQVTLYVQAYNEVGGSYLEKAFMAAEASKSHVITETLRNRSSNQSKHINEPLRFRLHELTRNTQEATYKLGILFEENASKEEIQELKAQRADYLSQYAQLQNSMSPASAENPTTFEQSPTPTSIAQFQKELDGDTTLFVYAFDEQALYCWSITSKEVVLHRLGDKADIEKLVSQAIEFITKRNHPDKFQTEEETLSLIMAAAQNYRSVSKELSQILLSPLVAHSGNFKLVIVPDGVLHKLPFYGLPDPSEEGAWQPILENHLVINANSATLAVQLKHLKSKEQGPMSAAIFADPIFNDQDPRYQKDQPSDKLLSTPDLAKSGIQALTSTLSRGSDTTLQRLPHTKDEALALEKLFPKDRVYSATGAEANWNNFQREATKEYSILHIATHGNINSSYPELCRFALSGVDPDGIPEPRFVTLLDIANMDIKADLVVLSACESSLGTAIDGAGQVGLTQGFFLAGANKVVGSLWKIEDKATSILMSRFYYELVEEKRSAPEAMREAQRHLWRSEKWRDPYYWAAFTYQGAW